MSQVLPVMYDNCWSERCECPCYVGEDHCRSPSSLPIFGWPHQQESVNSPAKISCKTSKRILSQIRPAHPKASRAFQDPPTQIISRNTGGLGRLHGGWRGAGMLRVLWCLDGRLGDCFSFTLDVVMLFKIVQVGWKILEDVGTTGTNLVFGHGLTVGLFDCLTASFPNPKLLRKVG